MDLERLGRLFINTCLPIACFKGTRYYLLQNRYKQPSPLNFCNPTPAERPQSHIFHQGFWPLPPSVQATPTCRNPHLCCSHTVGSLSQRGCRGQSSVAGLPTTASPRIAPVPRWVRYSNTGHCRVCNSCQGQVQIWGKG